MKLNWDASVFAGYDSSTTQVDLPEEVASRIIRWGETHIPDDVLFEDDDGTKGREDNIHCTILYGIKTTEPESVIALLENKPKIYATLDKVSLFDGNEDYDVVKIDVISPELHDLFELLSDNLENDNSFPEYKPHVTIAYVKKSTGDQYVDADEFDGTELVFDCVKFSNKDEEPTLIALQGNVASVLHWDTRKAKGE